MIKISHESSMPSYVSRMCTIAQISLSPPKYYQSTQNNVKLYKYKLSISIVTKSVVMKKNHKKITLKIIFHRPRSWKKISYSNFQYILFYLLYLCANRFKFVCVHINVMRSRLNGVVSFYDGAATLTQPFGGALYFEYILFNK